MAQRLSLGDSFLVGPTVSRRGTRSWVPTSPHLEPYGYQATPPHETEAGPLLKPMSKPPPIEFMVGEPFAIPRGYLSAIGGPRGVGKTSIAVDLCIHVALGLPWLGATTTRGRVLYLEFEGAAGKAWVIREKVIRTLARSVPGVEALHNNHDLMLVDLAQDKHRWRHLSGMVPRLKVEAHGYDLIVIDAYEAAAGIDTNDTSAVERSLDELRSLARKLNLAVLFLDHPPKANRWTLRGSGRKEDLVRSLHFLDKDKAAGVVTWHPEKTTFAREEPAFRVAMDQDDSTFRLRRVEKGKSALTGSTETITFPLRKGPPYANALPPVAIESGDAVLAVLHHNGEMSKGDLYNQVALAVDRKPETIRKRTQRTLDRLVEQGNVVRIIDDRDKRVQRFKLP